MGFIRKITGVQAQVDAAEQNNANQVAAAEQSAEAARAAARAQAEAAAQAQANMIARQQAEDIARESLAPQENIDVQLDAPDANSVAATRRRRGTFGRNYTGGTVSARI